jgi:UrcA family protein
MMLTMSRSVSYHDLDLRSAEDVATLEGRVREAALDLCHELDRRYSPTIYVPLFDTKKCQAETTQNGLSVVDALAALARN